MLKFLLSVNKRYGKRKMESDEDHIEESSDEEDDDVEDDEEDETQDDESESGQHEESNDCLSNSDDDDDDDDNGDDESDIDPDNCSKMSKICLRFSDKPSKCCTNRWRVVIGEHGDKIISKSLKQRLLQECKSLIHNKQKLNYRNIEITNVDSNSYLKIQELIEPSTPSKYGLFYQPLLSKYYNIYSWRNHKNIPKFIPTLFKYNQSIKKYEIKGEINDLPRFQYVELYKTIQEIFNKLVPNINRCLDIYPLESDKCSDNNFLRQTEELESKISKLMTKMKRNITYHSYKVIVKMMDYQFMHKKLSRYRSGSNYCDAFTNLDDIEAVALYYFDVTDNVQGGQLAFQDFPKHDSYTMCKTNDNQCVIFCNNYDYRHCIHEMNINFAGNIRKGDYDKNGEKIYGTKKVLAFFVVDPENDDMKTTESLEVNVAAKSKYVIIHWYRMMVKSGFLPMALIKLIEIFAYGDNKYQKMKTDQVRQMRHEYDESVIRYQNVCVQGQGGTVCYNWEVKTDLPY